MVTDDGTEPDSRSSVLDGVLATLLERHPAAFVFALTDAVTQVPLPADRRFARVVHLVNRNRTLMHGVVPDDRASVVRIWEAARSLGAGHGPVRLESAPRRSQILAIVDMRHRYGLWIGFLVPENEWRTHEPALPADPALSVPLRPRTAVITKDQVGAVTAIDERATEMLGWLSSEMVGRSALDFVHPDDRPRAFALWVDLHARREPQRARLRYAHRNGGWVWIEIENEFVAGEGPDGPVAVGHLTDISDEMAAHEAVVRREQLFRRLTESLPVGVLQVTADRQVVFANERLVRLLAVPGARTVDEQFATVRPRDRRAVHDALDDALSARCDREVEVEVEPEPADGTGTDGARRRCLVTIAPLPADPETRPGAEGAADLPGGAILSVTDISVGARVREELRVRATFDALTGCLNRATTVAELERLLEGPDGAGLAVVFVDLNGFKAVNDEFGHPVGDDLLVVAARRLLSHARRSDLVGRIGGDEFLVICPRVRTREQALGLAGRFQRSLRGRARVGGQVLRTRASIGVALAEPGTTVDALVARADSAMYAAKRAGGERPVFFGDSPELSP